jgi:hypothetical protein
MNFLARSNRSLPRTVNCAVIYIMNICSSVRTVNTLLSIRRGGIGSSLLEYGRFIYSFVSDESAGSSQVIAALLQHLAEDYAEDWLLKAGTINPGRAITWMLIGGGSLTDEQEELMQAHQVLLTN